MLNKLIMRYPRLAECEADIRGAIEGIVECYERGGKLLTCGNGGSCADADHIVGELMKGFLKKRPLSEGRKQELLSGCRGMTRETADRLQGALPAVSLCCLTALNTAFSNDVDPDLIYAQGVLGLGTERDALLCISTSGNAKNVFLAASVAKGLGMTVIALTGRGGGKLSEIADVCIKVPESETYLVQELHLPIYHCLCATVEEHFFSE